MKFEAPKNKNYCAIVVQLDKFVDLPNCDNVKAALIFGNSVIISKDAQAGDTGLFFPLETSLSEEFMSNNNLFREATKNVDPTKKGFFENHGRVKAMKFRGHKSEGFFIPATSINYLDPENSEYLYVGQEFDAVEGHPICQKYIPKGNKTGGQGKGQPKKASVRDRIVENQFRYHIDTDNLRRNMHRIPLGQPVSISDKWHGTSAIFANLLIKRKLNWFERMLQKFGVAIQESDYDVIWSSRRVIKGVAGEAKTDAMHYYQDDVWSVVAKELEGKIDKGMTIYGEIVGFTPSGQAIQPGYHYGCSAKQHRFLVYRITMTNVDGKVIELSWDQMKAYCQKFGLEMVKELFRGTLGQFMNHELSDNRDIQEYLLGQLEKYYVNDSMCPHNNNEVPAEGIVVRIDGLDFVESFKLKNFKFLEWETKSLDKGDVDMETQESTEEEE